MVELQAEYATPFMDGFRILGMVSGAAITVLSTIVMAMVLERIGFFRWASINLANRANGSGIALFWHMNLLCFLITLFFNHDGSILITTPILIQTLALLNLKPVQKFPYLLSGALIAAGSGAIAGSGNLATLIALKMVGLDLNAYAEMMLIPVMAGMAAISLLILVYFRKEIPKNIPILPPSSLPPIRQGHAESHLCRTSHPPSAHLPSIPSPDWKMFSVCILIVVSVKISFFALAPLGIPTEYPAVAGAVLFVLVRMMMRKTEKGWDDVRKTPWHMLILFYCIYVIFSLCVLLYAMPNADFALIIAEQLGPYAASGPVSAILMTGLLLTVLANLCTHLPSLTIGILFLVKMGLDVPVLHVAYLAGVIGADIGSLLLPMGTLATLLWMGMLKKNEIPVSWGQYLKATILAIPAGLFISLFSLCIWTQWLFF